MLPVVIKPRPSAFPVFLVGLSGVTISLSALVAIAIGLPWDGMPWLVLFLASLLGVLVSAKRGVVPRKPSQRRPATGMPPLIASEP